MMISDDTGDVWDEDGSCSTNLITVSRLLLPSWRQFTAFGGIKFWSSVLLFFFWIGDPFVHMYDGGDARTAFGMGVAHLV